MSSFARSVEAPTRSFVFCIAFLRQHYKNTIKAGSFLTHEPAIAMDQHTGVDGHQRHDSASSVGQDVTHTSKSRTTQEQPIRYTSFPSPSAAAHRAKPATSSPRSNEESRRIEAKYARYTDAPPQYTDHQYAGKSEAEQISMRISDYAKEISRAMGRQLVRDLNTAQRRAK